MQGLSPVAASGGHSSSRCAGLSLSRPLSLPSTGSRRAGSVVVPHGLSYSVACGILPDQGSNPCPLHWQADSQPLCHQGSPPLVFLKHSMLTSIRCGVQTSSEASSHSSLSSSRPLLYWSSFRFFYWLSPLHSWTDYLQYTL